MTVVQLLDVVLLGFSVGKHSLRFFSMQELVTFSCVICPPFPLKFLLLDLRNVLNTELDTSPLLLCVRVAGRHAQKIGPAAGYNVASSVPNRLPHRLPSFRVTNRSDFWVRCGGDADDRGRHRAPNVVNTSIASVRRRRLCPRRASLSYSTNYFENCQMDHSTNRQSCYGRG